MSATPDITRSALEVIEATDYLRALQSDLTTACRKLDSLQEPLRAYLNAQPLDGPQAITLTDSPWGPVTINLEPSQENPGGPDEITFRRTQILRVV